MRINYQASATRLVLVLLALLVSGVAPAANGAKPTFSQDKQSVQSRLDNVRRLVHKSSGARRVAESGDSAALALRDEAARHLDSAQAAFDGGDMGAASTSLHTATERMFKAIRQAGTGSAGRSKKSDDFKNKADSTDVLLTALERIAKEKGIEGDIMPTVRVIRGEVTRAQGMARAGKLDEARAALDKSYDKAKLELEHLRGGETLVRTLNFANKEEEYHYELDRNDTHQMLLKVLLEDKTPSPKMKTKIDGYVKEAGSLRGTAEKQAGGGKFDKAVETLEQATKQLQRAIRSAGVYIPG